MRGLTEALRTDLYGSRIGVTLYESGAVESPYLAHNPGTIYITASRVRHVSLCLNRPMINLGATPPFLIFL